MPYDGAVTLQLYGTPQSMNELMYRHWRVQRRAKKQWETDLALMMMAERLPKRCEFVTADALLTFAVNRKRDVDNFSGWFVKSLGDALQTYGAITDDTPDHFRFGRLEMRSISGGQPHTDVFLRYRLRGGR